MKASASLAHSISSSRRARLMVTPRGNWCEGETQAMRARDEACLPARRRCRRRRPAPARRRHRWRQGADEARIAGLLDPDRVARVEQHPGGEVERLLGTGDDEDLLRLAAHGAGGAEIGGQRLAQGPKPAGSLPIRSRLGGLRQVLASRRAQSSKGNRASSGRPGAKALGRFSGCGRAVSLRPRAEGPGGAAPGVVGPRHRSRPCGRGAPPRAAGS
jgi:hypothetical protein